MTIADAAQAALDKVLYAESVHVRDAHSGELPERCSTCVALAEAVEACRIAAVEATTLPERAAPQRRRPRKG
jgi:hypothetical protein